VKKDVFQSVIDTRQFVL